MNKKSKFFDEGITYGAVIFRKRLCKGWFITDRIKDDENGVSLMEDEKTANAIEGVGLDKVIV